jgi:hypothetical protein
MSTSEKKAVEQSYGSLFTISGTPLKHRHPVAEIAPVKDEEFKMVSEKLD